MDIKTKIKGYCDELGLDTIGFTECRGFYELKGYFESRKTKGLENEFEEVDLEARLNPSRYLEDGKTIISIAFPYLYFRGAQKAPYFSKYTQGYDYHKVVKKYLDKICDFIVAEGGKAIGTVDSNSLPERYIATLAGIGFIGKNNLLITERYGSYVFLGEIITDLEIAVDTKKSSLCGECDICLKACPTSSITESESNPNICLSYISQKKEVDEYLEVLKGRLFGCDTCQDVCPFNKNAELSRIADFEPKEFMRNVDIQELTTMTNKTFNVKYKMTSCGWRGKNVLKRNADNYMKTVIK